MEERGQQCKHFNFNGPKNGERTQQTYLQSCMTLLWKLIHSIQGVAGHKSEKPSWEDENNKTNNTIPALILLLVSALYVYNLLVSF